MKEFNNKKFHCHLPNTKKRFLKPILMHTNTFFFRNSFTYLTLKQIFLSKPKNFEGQ